MRRGPPTYFAGTVTYTQYFDKLYSLNSILIEESIYFIEESIDPSLFLGVKDLRRLSTRLFHITYTPGAPEKLLAALENAQSSEIPGPGRSASLIVIAERAIRGLRTRRGHQVLSGAKWGDPNQSQLCSSSPSPSLSHSRSG